jgi:hypothetical protein
MLNLVEASPPQGTPESPACGLLLYLRHGPCMAR